jgi:hypothetical protein
VTPAIHTTLGTGVFPWKHAITNIPVRDEHGTVVDAFLKGESSRFLAAPALAERWDEQTGNRALVGMVGYEPWHLGMIGQGAERPGGDKDDAAWLNIDTNQWISNASHYRLPRALVTTPGLEADLARTDAADGRVDGSWRDNHIIDQPDRVEEVPGFIDYHTRGMERMIQQEGYGADRITDLLFTNYKQIDRNGHYYNMSSDEVDDSIVESDKVLGRLPGFLNRTVGRGSWVIVVTADHGQQPDASAVDGYGINPREVESDIDDRFGDGVTRAVWPTEVFFNEDVMAKDGVSVAEIARFLYRYRLKDSTQRPDIALAGAGRFGPDDRLFQMAIPAHLIPDIACGS